MKTAAIPRLPFTGSSGTNMISLALFEDDYVTKNMIQEFIVDEQDHFNWVRQHLSLMEEIGMENYLIEQLG